MTEQNPSAADLAAQLDRMVAEQKQWRRSDNPADRVLGRRYEDFMNPAPLPDEADSSWAGDELDRRLKALTPLASTISGNPDRVRQSSPKSRRSPFQRWIPQRRPFLAVAAVVVLAVGMLSLRSQLLDPASQDQPILRGRVVPSQILDVSPVQDGVALAWHRPVSADRSVIVLFDDTFVEIARIEAGNLSTMTLAPEVVATARYARVEFIADGDVIQTTRIHPLP